MSDVPAAPTDARQAQYLDRVRRAIRAGDLPLAGTISVEALSEGLADPLLFKMRALRLEGQGKLEDAAADFRSALQFDPNDAGALNALGLCLARLGRPWEALPHLDKALQVQPAFSGAAFNKGWALESMGELAAARSAYQHALDLDASNYPALSSLASISARAGDLEAARSLAGRALAIDAGDPAAILALATADIGEKHYGEAETRLRGLLDGGASRLTAHSAAVAEGLLADALDGQDRTKEAFQAYSRENDLQRRLYANRFGLGGSENGRDYVERLTRLMRASDPADWRAPEASEPAPSPARRHVFLVGFPRSGTTLLGQVLAAHPDVVTLDEKETLLAAVQAFMVYPEDLEKLKGQPDAALEQYRDLYWRGVREYGVEPEGKVFVDKLPMNTLKLPLIARLFPDATILYARRDPRDVVLSCFRRHFVVNPTTWEFLTLEGATGYYQAMMRLVDVLEEKLPLSLQVQRHEDLVADFDGVTRALCDRLGLEWNAAMADFAEKSRARSIATPSAGQVAGGLTGEGVGQWRRYAEQMAPVLPVLQTWAERFDYPA